MCNSYTLDARPDTPYPVILGVTSFRGYDFRRRYRSHKNVNHWVEIVYIQVGYRHTPYTDQQIQQHASSKVSPINMASFQPPATMRAVVYKGPHEVAVEDKPYPKLQTDTDCILKVTTSALCGSDLHFYRGHLDVPAGFTCGHEFVGEIVEKGSAVQKFSYGEKVSLLI